MNVVTNRDRELLRSFGRFSETHPAMLLTLCYLVVSLIGIAFSWSFFARFGVDFFEYAEIGDFLLAAFREPVTFILALGAVLVGLAVFLFQLAVQAFYARFSERSKIVAWLRDFERRINPLGVMPSIFLLVIFYAAIFIYNYAGNKALDIQGGHGETVTVHFGDPLAGGETSTSALLMGNTLRAIFLYEVADARVRIVPLDAVVAIDMPPRASASDEPEIPGTPESSTEDEQ